MRDATGEELLAVGTKVRLTEGAAKGAVGWVSESVIPTHRRVDWEDGIRCVVAVEKLEVIQVCDAHRIEDCEECYLEACGVK